MSTSDDRDPAATVSEQAAEWYLILKDNWSLPMSERRLFWRWLCSSPRNIYEFLLVRLVNAGLVRLVFSKRQGENAQAKVTHVNWWRGSAHKPAKRSRRLVASSVAATALLLSLAFLVPFGTRDRDQSYTISTSANQSKTETLIDGSVVTLGARSRVRVEYSKHRRGVHLLDGEALFAVEKDAARPFVVSTFLVDITAVGTKFGVMADTSVTVRVDEGVVEVSNPEAKPGSAVVTLKQGDDAYRVPVGGFPSLAANIEARPVEE